MTVTGVITLLFARGHYSIDVLIAYWITTRVWWIYHTMANNPQFMIGEARKNNYLLNIWWMYIFQYFEGRVGRPVPKGFNFPWPSRLRQYRPEVITTARSRRRRTRREAEDAEAAEAEEGVIAGGGLP
jgi:shingomyelin synthase